MSLHRTILAVLLSLTMAFLPVASIATAKPCTMAMAMTAQAATDCPCHNSMPNCDVMPQCMTGAGCASQCSGASGVLPSLVAKFQQDRDAAPISVFAQRASLSIEPPSPPPRA